MSTPESPEVTFREAISASIRYWEPRRLSFAVVSTVIDGAATNAAHLNS